MPNLGLHERRVVAGLDQVRNVGVAQAVQAELLRQSDGIARCSEGVADAAERDAIGSFTRPQRGGTIRGGEPISPTGRSPDTKHADDPVRTLAP